MRAFISHSNPGRTRCHRSSCVCSSKNRYLQPSTIYIQHNNQSVSVPMPPQAERQALLGSPTTKQRYVKILVGYLVRLTTCKRLTTNGLPKVSLATLSSPETAGRSAGYTGGPVNYPSRFISWVYREEYFSSSTWGKSEKLHYHIIYGDTSSLQLIWSSSCDAERAMNARRGEHMQASTPAHTRLLARKN